MLPHDDDDRPGEPYKVGFGKPPLEHQFKKGRSGNRHGRPKRSRNVTTIVREIASEAVTVRDGSRTRRVSKLELLVHAQVNKALRGDARAYHNMEGLLDRAGLLEDAPEEEGRLSPQEQEQLQELLDRLGSTVPTREDPDSDA